MKIGRHWWKFGIVALAMTILGGCSVMHSELGEILDEKNSFSEYWQWEYPGHETGNRNRYMGRN